MLIAHCLGRRILLCEILLSFMLMWQVMLRCLNSLFLSMYVCAFLYLQNGERIMAHFDSLGNPLNSCVDIHVYMSVKYFPEDARLMIVNLFQIHPVHPGGL